MSKINFEIESAEVIQDNKSSQFATARLRLFSTGPNRHNMTCTEDILKKTASSAYEKPVIFEMRYGGDFGTHSDKTVPAGFIVKDSAEFEMQEDGRLALFVVGKVWKMYSGKFLEVFKNKKKDKSKLSVEMELLDYEEKEDGMIEMKNFEYTAACILGDMVTEASPGAEIQMLSFAYEEAYKKEFEMYKNIDFSIPRNVKDNVSSAIDLYRDGEQEVTATSLSVGKYLINNSMASPEKLKNIQKYLSKNLKDPKKYLSCLMYGGKEGLDWVSGIIEKMDQEELENKEEKVDGLEEEKIQMEEPTEEKVEMSEEEKPEDEKPEDSKEEDSKEEDREEEEEDEEENKAEMSLDTNLDVAAILAMLENETEDYQELVDSHKNGNMDFAKVCNAMYGKMQKMQAQMAETEEKNRAYMAENESLRSFKAQYEEREFNFAVERVLNEVANVMPSDKIKEQREDSQNFDLYSLDAWENKTKAIAFSYAAKDVKKSDGVTRVGLPFTNTDAKTNASIWKR